VTFTYNLASTDETLLAISKIRLELGDTVSGVGVRPDWTNLSDEEITVWLTAESNMGMRSVARACEALARMWASVTNVTVGPRKEEMGKVADAWAKQAQALRDVYGGSSGSAFSVGLAREDGYSIAAEASE
jgi:hypothetical protein